MFKFKLEQGVHSHVKWRPLELTGERKWNPQTKSTGTPENTYLLVPKSTTGREENVIGGKQNPTNTKERNNNQRGLLSMCMCNYVTW